MEPPVCQLWSPRSGMYIRREVARATVASNGTYDQAEGSRGLRYAPRARPGGRAPLISNHRHTFYFRSRPSAIGRDPWVVLQLFVGEASSLCLRP